ncbi:MAG: hypothetical protein BMS9Abin12_1220 [Acidimicrobiia bacterium]|nr:MAG: hypothetical protein BMS9Abin12_1220 [Acidimicrobiia bacterium]
MRLQLNAPEPTLDRAKGDDLRPTAESGVTSVRAVNPKIAVARLNDVS